MIFVFVLLYVIIGVINYGATLYEFNKNFPYMKNLGIAIFMGVMGPVSIPAILIYSGYEGFLFRPPTREQRWEKFRERFDILGREYFDKHYY